jgi:hypothetical protein
MLDQGLRITIIWIQTAFNLIKVNRRNQSFATIFSSVFNYIFIICRYMFRPLLAIFRRKYTIIILGSYLNYNGAVGFLLAPIYCMCNMRLWIVQMFTDHFDIKGWNLKVLKMFFRFFLAFLLRFINILMSCCCLVTSSRYLFYSANSSPVLFPLPPNVWVHMNSSSF